MSGLKLVPFASDVSNISSFGRSLQVFFFVVQRLQNSASPAQLHTGGETAEDKAKTSVEFLG